MNNKRKHFKMACLTSVAVLLGACSSTPDVKTEAPAMAKSQAYASLEQSSINKVPQTKPIKQVPVRLATRVKTAPAVVAAKPLKRVVAKRKPVPKLRYVRAKPKPRYIAPKAKPNYIPPKPIVVAVHRAPKPVVRTVMRRPAKVVKPQRRVVAKRYQQPAVRPRVVTNSKLRRPSLPRASAAVVYGGPVIRPATVPRSTESRVATRSAYARSKQAADQRRFQQAQKLRVQQAQQQQLKMQQKAQQQLRVRHTYFCGVHRTTHHG